MKYLTILLFLLASCSSGNHRKPSVEKELCFDYNKNTIICKNENDCYLSNISGTKTKSISCDEFSKRDPRKDR